MPLTSPTLGAIVLTYISNLRQSLRNAILYLLFLRVSIIRIVLQAIDLFLLNRRDPLVAILLYQVNFLRKLFGLFELIGKVVNVGLHLVHLLQ